MRDISGLFCPKMHAVNRSNHLFDDRSVERVFRGKLLKHFETLISTSGKRFHSKYDQNNNGSVLCTTSSNPYIHRPFPPIQSHPPSYLPSSTPPQLSPFEFAKHLASEQRWAGDSIGLRLVGIIYDSWVSGLVCARECDL